MVKSTTEIFDNINPGALENTHPIFKRFRDKCFDTANDQNQRLLPEISTENAKVGRRRKFKEIRFRFVLSVL